MLELLRPGLSEVTASSLPDYRRAGLARLDCNELCLPPSDEELAMYRDAIARVPLHRYPDVSGGPLRRALARRWDVAPEEILLGNGSVELIALLMLALGGDRRAVVYPDPSFPQYESIARTHGLEPLAVPLAPDFALDEARYADALHRQRPVLSLIASPNNPTGNRFDPDVLLRLAADAPGAFVIDEAYTDFGGQSLLGRRKAAPGLLILRTLSKIGFAGLRVGALVGQPDLIARLDRARLPWNVNALSMAVACAALEHPERIEARLDEVVRLRAALMAELVALGDLCVYPSDANFVLVRSARPAREIEMGLLERGVVIKNVSRAGALEGCLRITVGTAEENGRLLEGLREISRGRADRC
jgi:histidinol-phosphate aminotransferase